MVDGRDAFKSLTGKTLEKRLLQRPRSRWEENFRIDLEEIGVKKMNLINLA
jgi:hypothetical protein